MATSKISVTEGTGKNLATYTITEDTTVKELQRLVLVDSSGAEIPLYPATQPVSGTVALSNPTANPETGLAKETKQDTEIAALASILAKIIAAPATEAKQDTLNAKDFATQTTLALIKAKTDNLDVLLSTRTKPADTQPVSAVSLPLPTGAATETTVNSLLKPASTLAAVTDITNPVKTERANLAVTATGASGAAVTATLPAAASQFHNITMIEIVAYNAVARVGGATPVTVTTTNLNSMAFTFASAGAIGTTDKTVLMPTLPIRSAVANTATTIVCPATPSVIWRVNVVYGTSL